MVDLALSHPILSFLLTTLLALSAYLIRRVFILPYQNPLYNLPGPDTESYIWGNLFKFFKYVFALCLGEGSDEMTF
jgi:hypothetical protein